MIRGKRAVSVLVVVAIAAVLYGAGYFESEGTTAVSEKTPAPMSATPTSPAVVETVPKSASLTEEPFVHVVEEGDRLALIAAKYNVTTDAILEANLGLDPDILIVGQHLRVPGATTDNTVLDNPSTDRELGEQVRYIVQAGDSFAAIAAEYTVSLPALLDANDDVDPTALRIGQRLVIPPYGSGLSSEAIAARTSSAPVASEGSQAQYYVVQPGDLLVTIADLYDVDVDQIMAINGLGGDQIIVGQRLLIPPPTFHVDH